MARVTTITCNLCGKTFTEIDKNQHFTLYTKIQYGSKFDGNEVMLDICTSCMDKLIESCVVSPLADALWE